MKKGIKLDISSDFDLNDLIKQRFKKNVNLRISWKDFFNYPFFIKNIEEIMEMKIQKKLELI